MKYWVKVVDGEIVKILDDRWSIEGDSLVGKRGPKREVYVAAEFTQVTADFSTEIIVKDGVAKRKAKAQRDKEKADSEKENNRKSKKEHRINKLNKTTIEVDGKVFQARESDELYLRGKIARLADGESTRWILDNNNVTTVTKEQLIQVLNKGFDEGQAIFDEYMDDLEAQGRVE